MKKMNPFKAREQITHKEMNLQNGHQMSR